MNSLIILSVVLTSLCALVPAQTPSIPTPNIETKTAIVTADTTEGNYLEFLDGSGGWWLEADGEHPTFEVGQVMRFTIDNQGTTDLGDDKLLILDSLGFIEESCVQSK